MVTTKKKPVVDTQKIKRKESQYTATRHCYITKEDKEEEREKDLQNSENNEQNSCSTSITISNNFKCIKFFHQKSD